MSQRRYYPFMLLKALRDGKINTVEDLDYYISDEARIFSGLGPYTRAVRDLQSAGLLTLHANGRVEVHRSIGDIFKASGISLTSLEEFNDESTICNPIFGLRGQIDSFDVFVVMPFKGELKPIYEDHIKPVVGKLGLSAARGDDFFTTHSVMNDIYTALSEAKVVVADCTTRSANVFYEIGISHTLGKPVICIAQDPADIPFDLHHLRHIIYEYTPRGMRAFEDSLEATLETVVFLRR